MSGLTLLFWIAMPYVAIAVFVVGHVWRWRVDQYGWTTRSSQLQESRLLSIGGPIFHYATFAAIGGHVLGILIPASWTAAVGIDEGMYRAISASLGTIAGLLVAVGLLVLVYRRVSVPRVRVTTSRTDVLAYVLLTIVIGLGLGETVGVNLLGGGYDYRSTVALWFRGLFLLNPRPELMVSAPPVYQAHVILAWLLFMVWPFSRLVHAWSYPLMFLGRPWILYRSYPQDPGGAARGRREPLTVARMSGDTPRPAPGERDGTGDPRHPVGGRGGAPQDPPGRDGARYPIGGHMPDVLLGLARRLRLRPLQRRYNSTLVLGIFALLNGCVSIALMSAVALLTHQPFVFPSLGPTAFLLFHSPHTAAASPRNTFIGHLVGVVCGYLALVAFGLLHAGSALSSGVTPARAAAAGLSLGLTAGVMVWLRAPHPPAGATTLIVSLGMLTRPDQLAVLMLGVVILLAQGYAINRLAGLDYPLWSARPTAADDDAGPGG